MEDSKNPGYDEFEELLREALEELPGDFKALNKAIDFNEENRSKEC